MKKQALLELLKQHKEKLTTVEEWNEYARKHKLPLFDNIRYHFGSWSNLKKELGLTVSIRAYKRDELEIIALQYKEKFLRKSIWDEFSKENKLPASATFIKAFGSWNQVKEFVGLENEKRKKDLYSKEDIRVVLTEHRENYINRKQWDEYAKEHKLPTYKTIKKHFDYDEVLAIVQHTPHSAKSKDELMKIAIVHQEQFLKSSMKKWDEYARKLKLPSSYVFFKAFGSWRKAKTEVMLMK